MHGDVKMENKEPDIYYSVVLEIRDAIKEDLFDNGLGFGEEKQKKIADILKRNFNKNNEQIGHILMEDVNMFYVDTGDIIGVPLFLTPITSVHGFRSITPKIYPNYNIYNEYMGYTDNGTFHKINKAGSITKSLRGDKFALIYIILVLLVLIILVWK